MRKLLGLLAALPLLGGTHIFAQQQISSTTKGGSANNPSTWVGGQVPGQNQQAVIKGPVVLDSDWLSGVYGIVVNGGSFTSDGAPHTLSIGSYGNDPVGASCGGAVGRPGTCATMFGITQTGNGGAVSLNNITIVTPDGISPIYTRNQVYGNHPSDFTLQNCSIQNLGSSIGSNGYSGLVFATSSLPSLNVVVNNCNISRYYRLLYGGTGNGIQSSLTWTNNRSEHEAATDYGSLVLTSAGFLRTDIENNTDRHPDGTGSYIYSYDIGFTPVIRENRIQGGTYKRGLYQTLSPTYGTGNAIIVNNMCLNYSGSKGSLSCVGLRSTKPTDQNTVIAGLVSTGNWETVSQRPPSADRSTPTRVMQSFLQEDWDTCNGQGIIMVNGTSLIATNNVLRVASTKPSCPYNIGFFDYASTTNSVVDNNTIVGTHGVGTIGAMFGESGFGVFNQKARNNIVIGWEYCFSDNNRAPSQSTYAADSDIGAGIHHNATYDCTQMQYRDYGGPNFKNQANTPHPNLSAYGDVSGINPAFVDPTYRDPFKYDAAFGGTGDGEWMFSQFAAGELTTAQVREWIFQGYAPTSQSYRAGYQGNFIGAVQPQ
jgi:hypothetical protein